MTQKQLHSRLAGFYFVYFLMLGGIAPYFSLYLSKLGFSGVQIGTLLALMPLARVFAPQCLGLDRGPQRRPPAAGADDHRGRRADPVPACWWRRASAGCSS